jgi:uncharacterized membrane protein YesL
MARQVKKHSRIKKSAVESPFKNYWDKSNYVILGIGIAVLVIGFYLMTFGPWDNPVSLTISPIVLLVAYLFIFPLSILYKKKKQNGTNKEDVPSKS